MVIEPRINSRQDTPEALKAETRIQALLLCCGAWYLPQIAHAFAQRSSLAGLWISNRDNFHLGSRFYRRCWPFHLAMKPFYHWAPQIWGERAFYFFFWLWKLWLKSQPFPPANVIYAVYGYATEPFDRAERTGALKVIDCPNSHPLTFHGIWQRECDLWCPGEKVPIPRWMLGRMTRELERADLIIVQSEFGKESMVMNGLPEERVFVNPMGVDTTLFRKRVSVPPQPRFICVGTICLRKGHQYLFPAFELVKKKLPQAQLTCVGGYKTDFRLQRPKWEGRFIHHPSLTQKEISELLQQSTAFVFPSQEEGISRAQIEALASGLPVIGTHHGGATTLVRDGVEGIIVHGRDPRELAQAMIKLAENPALNATMGDAAYARGAVQNTWQDYGDRLLSRFARCLSDREELKPRNHQHD